MPTQSLVRLLYACTAIALLVAAAIFAIHYRNQPLIDLYSFRQTQTALTSYWFIRDGWKLAYETPVGGAPWSIPFEFPIYQTIAAVLSSALKLDLDPVGRLLSFAFLVLCVIPARQLQRRLELSTETFWIFCCLLFSAPIYVYWGRTFMIETMALFFTLASLPYFVDLLHGVRMKRAVGLFCGWTALSLLQKVTTGLPVVAILGIVWLIHLWRADPRLAGLFTRKNLIVGLIAFAIPVALAFAWTEYSSALRAQNPVGAYLTNSKLTQWNWGTWEQRLSERFWVEVLWKRVLQCNIAGVIGVLTIVASLAIGKPGGRRSLIVTCLLLGLLPFLTFTNLYIIHDYYPTACVIFLLAAIAVALGRWTNGGILPRAAAIALLAVFIGNGIHEFKARYWPAATYRNRVAYLPELALGYALKENTSPDAAVLVYGYDWSSQIAYFSQRRSLTNPFWPGPLREVWSNPERYMGGKPLGAIAVCQSSRASLSPHQVEERFLTGDYYGGISANCTILVKKNGSGNSIKEGTPLPAKDDCKAHINSFSGFPAEKVDESSHIVTVDASISGLTPSQESEPVFIALIHGGEIVRTARAIRVATFSKEPAPPRFSGMIDTRGLSGTDDVAILRSDSSAGLAQCTPDKDMRVPHGDPRAGK